MPHTDTTALEQIHAALALWFDEDDAQALEHACVLARSTALEIDALLSWTRDYGGSSSSTSLALRRLRFAIGLPVIAGPVCRRPTGS